MKNSFPLKFLLKGKKNLQVEMMVNVPMTAKSCSMYKIKVLYKSSM